MNCTLVAPPSYLSYFTASVSALLLLVTVPGNMLVLITVYKDPHKELRTPFCLFVVNLTVADLIVGCVVEPISIVFHIQEALSDGTPLCNVAVIHMAYFISCTTSVLSLAALTFDRFTAIEWPLHYRTKQSAKRAAIVSLFIWMISLSIPFVYFHVGYIVYAFVFANTSIILTLFILVFSYMRILKKMRVQSKAVTSSETGLSRIVTRRRSLAREDRITKVFILVIAAYGCCYAPSCVLIYLMNFCRSCSCYSVHWFRDMQFVFVLLNSGINPFLYSWRLPSFKNAFKAILRRSVHKKHSSSTTSGNNIFGKKWDLRSRYNSIVALESIEDTLSVPKRHNQSAATIKAMMRNQRTVSLPVQPTSFLRLNLEMLADSNSKTRRNCMEGIGNKKEMSANCDTNNMEIDCGNQKESIDRNVGTFGKSLGDILTTNGSGRNRNINET